MLRFIAGPSWGLPFRYDPDEGFFIQPAIDMYRSKNYNPNWFGHPGSTIIYINMIAYVLLSKFYIIFTELGTKNEVWEYLKVDPTSLFYLMRSIQVVIGSATVFMVYLVGKKISNHRVGIVAGLMVAMVPLMIHFSQIVRTDMLAALLMLFVVYKSLQVQESERLSNYIYAALGIAAAIATKYPAGLISLYLVWCHFSRVKGTGEFWKLAISGVLSFLFIFLFSPYMFLDYQSVIRDLILESDGYYIGAMSEGFQANFIWYLNHLVFDSIGFIGLIAFLLAGIASARDRNSRVFGLFVFCLIFMMAIAAQNVRWERWLVLVIPLTALVAAFGVNWLAIVINLKAVKHLYEFLALLMLVPICYMAVFQIYHRSETDTRTQTHNWITENIPSGSSLIIETYGPQLPSDKYKLFMLNDGDVVQRPQNPGYVMPAGRLTSLKSYEDLATSDVDYLVVTNFYDRYKLNPIENRLAINRYDEIFKKSLLIKEFVPSGGADVHPFKANVSGGLPIRIYKVTKE